jgi:hypothetical protein
VEGGRASADPVQGIVFYNFYKRPAKQLTSATWFVVDDSDENRIDPMSEHDAKVAEELYQKAIYASSSVGPGIESVMKEEADLENPDYKVMIAKADGKYCIRKSLKGWLGMGKSFDLQRGLGAYNVPGEDDEVILGPVRHVIFVVHGIGENMWARDDINIAGLVESINIMRNTMNKKMATDYRAKCEKANKAKEPEPKPPNRVEFIPIEWYEKLHSSSNSLMRSVKATTLSTIPALRAIANDVIFDVMMYMTPQFCFDVLECVTEQINSTFQAFQKIYPEFSANGGKASLMGHSLGSVICFDLLSVMHDFKKDPTETGKSKLVPSSGGVHITGDGQSDVGYQQYAHGENADVANNGSWGPSLSKRLDQCLPFVPEFTIFLGSPIGLFLTLRGAHAVFDDLRDKHKGDTKPKESPFTLPSGSVYNIFHPSDPVAYRIEPLLLSHKTEPDELPSPMYLTPHGQDVRLHVKAMQLGDEIRRKVTDTKSSINFFMNKAQNLLQQVEASSAVDSGSGTKNATEEERYNFPLGGKSDRIDYQLQPRVIDSEYISAVLAHSSYFTNSDVQDFIIGLVMNQKPKAEIKAATKDEDLVLDSLTGMLKHHVE